MKKSNMDGYAIAGLVIGIISVIFSFLYVWIGLIAGIVGIVLSVKGRQSENKKGLGTAGLVLSIIGTSLSGIFVVCAICVVGTAVGIGSSLGSL